MTRTPSVSLLVLTQGSRPEALARLAETVAEEPFTERLLLSNGATDATAAMAATAPVTASGASMTYGAASVTAPGPGWKVLVSDVNLGVPGGRNHIAALAVGEVLLFVDDDAHLRSRGVVDRLASIFAADPKLGAVALRVSLPSGEGSQSQHVPRLGRAGAAVGGPVTAFVGGAVALRAEAFAAVGGYCSELFFAHEETDLAWRLLDAAWSIRYEPDLVLEHPPSLHQRHELGSWTSARNRVWIARRDLPFPLVVLYPTVWAVITTLRCRSWRELRAVASGTWVGVRQAAPGGRQPIAWRTAARLTRLGRPPVI